LLSIADLPPPAINSQEIFREFLGFTIERRYSCGDKSSAVFTLP
jgi:hypothetical protein